MLAVFLFTVMAWVFFRVGSCGHLSATEQIVYAFKILGSMFDVTHINWALTDEHLSSNAINVLLIIVVRQLYFHFRIHEIPRLKEQTVWRTRLEPVGIAVLILICVYMRGPGSAFIYFLF